jgi:AraC family transcriptional regulator of adaptative response / DNA-3-methyladenine glycosylase II
MITGLNKAAQYRAIRGKNKKYDGIFYVAVKTTGIYCRPSCAEPCPLQENCSFFDTVKKVESQGYQPCKQCHPGRLKNGLSVEILDSINAGEINNKGVHGLADSLHISERHLRRVVQDRTGSSPASLNKAKRLCVAKLLITQTKLSIIDVAFTAEFSSLRQFNDVFKDAFKTSPHKMRKAALLKKLHQAN